MGNKKNIFLIEDNHFDQLFFRHALKAIENAILCHIANNGKEALHKLSAIDPLPDLIFTDIHMPVMDGIECLSEIKKNPQIRDIPVIVLSSDTSQIEVVQKLGAKAFINKPDEYTQLQIKLEHFINMDFAGDIFITK